MAKHFTLDIKLGNAEMQTGYDVAKALDSIVCKLIDSLGDDELRNNDAGSVFDLNGNIVGGWKVSKK